MTRTMMILALLAGTAGISANASDFEASVGFDFSAGILGLQEDDDREAPSPAESLVVDEVATPNESEDDLAKQTQNPVADLISVPFQNNMTFPTGPGDDVLYVLNIQPVIPITLNDDWNLITRTILPVMHQPGLAEGLSSDNGLGDLQFSAFLSPADAGELIWGVGPVLRFPTASRDTLGSEKWSAGPSLVALTSTGPWVTGALVQNIWSYAGASDRSEVNQFLIQPFLNYNLPDGWYLTSSPSITADWKRTDGRWTVPLGGGIGKILRIGKLPVNAQVQAYYNVAKPDAIGEWTIRVQLQLLFPRP